MSTYRRPVKKSTWDSITDKIPSAPWSKKRDRATSRSASDVLRIETETHPGRWVRYPRVIERDIRRAYLKGEQEANFRLAYGRRRIERYRICFEIMAQINIRTAVRRAVRFGTEKGRRSGSRMTVVKDVPDEYMSSRQRSSTMDGNHAFQHSNFGSHFGHSNIERSNVARNTESNIERSNVEHNTERRNVEHIIESSNVARNIESTNVARNIESSNVEHNNTIERRNVVERSNIKRRNILEDHVDFERSNVERNNIVGNGDEFTVVRHMVSSNVGHIASISENPRPITPAPQDAKVLERRALKNLIGETEPVRTKLQKVGDADINFSEWAAEDESELREMRKGLFLLIAEADKQGLSKEEQRPLIVKLRRIDCALRRASRRVQVFVRARPDSKPDCDEQPTMLFTPTTVDVANLERDKYLFTEDNANRGNANKSKSLAFDAVFAEESQEEVFAEIRHLVTGVLAGKNAGVACYGRTGAGKTFTMYGMQGKQGMVAQTIKELFEQKKTLESQGREVTISFAICEMYNGNGVDLLNDNENKLTRADLKPHKMVAEDTKSGHKLLRQGFLRRQTCALGLNKLSHLIVKMFVKVVDTKTQTETDACLTLADLAGSERVAATDRESIRCASELNKAFSSLGTAITNRIKETGSSPALNGHIVTDMFQECLTGNGEFLLIANISQTNADFKEDLATLNYASRVANAS